MRPHPHHLLGSIIAAGLLACSSDAGTTAPALPVTPAPKVLLRELQVPNLPSPYYHFDYDSLGRLSAASFASGFSSYTVAYEAGRIKEMVSNSVGNQDKLLYVYDAAGRADTVRYIDSSGALYAFVTLSYKGPQLIGLERHRLLSSAFVLEKSMSFSYYADGNVEQITDHRPAVEGQQRETTTIDRFEQYDDKINVDGFGLIHNDFFDHLVLLPGVELQRGNPARETFTSDDLSFTVLYTYTYDDSRRPLAKNGTLLFTTGADVGKTVQISSQFSYY